MKNPFAGTFSSLGVRNFRLFAAGQLVSVAGTWMMVVAQDWLVLSVSGNSPAALGLVTALQFTPLLLLTLYGGRLADRHDKRRLLMVANVLSGTLALLLATLTLAGGVQLWHIYLFALGLGTVNAVEVPTRMAFVSELVGGDLLPNASSLSAAYFNTARILGPALGGLLISVLGAGPAMLANAASYAATVAALRLMRPGELHRADTARERARVVDGLRYVTARSDLLLPLLLVALTGLFGFNFQLTLPLLAKTVFHSGAATFGLLTTALAIGSLLGALATTVRRGRPGRRVVIGGALAFGALETVTGLAPTYLSAAGLLMLTGGASVYFSQAANHHIQLGTDPLYRGRVMALYTLVFQGSTPLGALYVSWTTTHFGARSGLGHAGLICLAAALLALAAGRLASRAAPGGNTGTTTHHAPPADETAGRPVR